MPPGAILDMLALFCQMSTAKSNRILMAPLFVGSHFLRLQVI